ncbi:MAG: M48 family metalloprotease [Armatimonadetes bacterium]|nr:M48 family metalloprotease [Armatimonadota bacterium]MDE2205269.1 M48 family metalloprotease [Armatimonadota bacterium]
MSRPLGQQSAIRSLLARAACVALGFALLLPASRAVALAQAGHTKPPTAARDSGVGPDGYADDAEVKLGRENADEFNKTAKFVTDPALVDRVTRIGDAIAHVANTVPIPALWGSSQLKKFHYTFRVVDDPDVNAFSLPGGFIYVYKGLLNFVHSDDELAGVLAHEITHVDHHHTMKLMHENDKIQKWILPLVALGAIASHSAMNGAYDVFLAANLYQTAKINTYGIHAEEDADHGAILLLTHTKYNPVGLYSFMLREAADERNHTYGNLGIYRTHPPGADRATSARELLESLHIPIRLSEVDPTLRATARTDPAEPAVAVLAMRGVDICRVVGMDGETAVQRGDRIAAQLNKLVDTHLQSWEVRTNADNSRVLFRGLPLLTPADAAAQNQTVPQLALSVGVAIAQIDQKVQLDSNPQYPTPQGH